MVATKEHCVYCFDALVCHFENKKLPKPVFDNHSYPLFVTWHKQSPKERELSLRGCIGTFSAKAIHDGLQEYALISALKDSRFSPISAKELSSLHCAVSLLCNFESCDVWDWEIGTHGLIIEFKDKNGKKFSGTYLPEVAKEQEWTREETVKSLIRKAGYRHSVTEDFFDTLSVQRYQSSYASLSYAEYLTLKA